MSYCAPNGLLTEPGQKNHSGDYSSEYPDFPELKLPRSLRSARPVERSAIHRSDCVHGVPDDDMDTEISLLANDFSMVAQLAGIRLSADELEVEKLPAPHSPPKRLPDGKTAVYIFIYQGRTLKVGQAGPNSGSRYTSQHYNPKGAPSTLARSILNRGTEIGIQGLSKETVGDWIKANTDRFNILLDESHEPRVRSLLEAFIQCRLDPLFEGATNQS